MSARGWSRMAPITAIICCGLGLIALTVAVDNLSPQGWLSAFVAIAIGHALVIPMCLFSWRSWRRSHNGHRDPRVVVVLLVMIYLMVVGGLAQKLYLRSILPSGLWSLRR